MNTNDAPEEVKPEVEVEETPAEEPEIETPPSSSEEPNEDPDEPEPEEESEPEEEEDEPEEPEEGQGPAEVIPKPSPKEVEGETPVERARRLEIQRLKGLLRQNQKGDLFIKPPAKQETEDDVLKDYDPEEIAKFDRLMKAKGYVRKDELQAQTFQERADETFNSFMEEHPEYSPETEKGAVLWDQFKGEFQRYKPPQSVKDLKYTLTRVHETVFGVKPSAVNLNKITAGQQKIKVASHAGKTGGGRVDAPVQRTMTPEVRTDMLKGFSEEDRKEMGL